MGNICSVVLIRKITKHFHYSEAECSLTEELLEVVINKGKNRHHKFGLGGVASPFFMLLVYCERRYTENRASSPAKALEAEWNAYKILPRNSLSVSVSNICNFFSFSFFPLASKADEINEVYMVFLHWFGRGKQLFIAFQKAWTCSCSTEDHL